MKPSLRPRVPHRCRREKTLSSTTALVTSSEALRRLVWGQSFDRLDNYLRDLQTNEKAGRREWMPQGGDTAPLAEPLLGVRLRELWQCCGVSWPGTFASARRQHRRHSWYRRRARWKTASKALVEARP